MYDVSAYHLRGLCSGLLELGFDVPALLAEANLDPALLADPEARIPEAQAFGLFLAAHERFGGEHFGLELAAHVPYGKLELVDYLVAASPTVEAAICALAHHADLCSSGIGYELRPGCHDGRRGMFVAMKHVVGIETFPAAALDYVWMLLLRRFRSVCGPAFAPKLWMRRVLQSEAARYVALAGAVPCVGDREVMFIAEHLWQMHNPRWDPMLQQLLAAHARDVSERLPSPGFSSQVRGAVADALRLGHTSIQAVAQRLSISSRSLQRRLQGMGVTYQDLLDDVRKELVLRLMICSELSLKEIADLSGYSDASAFGRAFRRWTGSSPAEYRREQAITRGRIRAQST